MAQEYEQLLLKNQLCFPMYACSRKIVGSYTPYLKPLGLTYTQYVVMMVLWEHQSISVKRLGKILFLDSGTLTPVVKSLEKKGFVSRERSREDERVVNVILTDKGKSLRADALGIPEKISRCIELSPEDAAALYVILNKLSLNFAEPEAG